MITESIPLKQNINPLMDYHTWHTIPFGNSGDQEAAIQWCKDTIGAAGGTSGWWCMDTAPDGCGFLSYLFYKKIIFYFRNAGDAIAFSLKHGI
jgi:hypothetical protein